MNKDHLMFMDRQVEDFKKTQRVYAVFAKILVPILDRAAKDLGIMAIVQSRPKDITSFIEKSFRKQQEMDKRGKGERRAFSHSFTDLCGARVIVEYKDQIAPVCAFIRKHFEIDESNSVNPDVLGACTFAYRPIHLIVSMKEGAFAEVLQRLRDTEPTDEARTSFDQAAVQLFARRDEPEDCDGIPLALGPKFKAEIQVRTLVEHAWSNLNHDRIYKGDVELPLVLKRDMNRISAVLEEADEDFARVVHSVDDYRTYKGRYLPDRERKEEIERLTLTFKHAPDRLGHACRLAKLENEMGAWDRASEILEPIVNTWRTNKAGTTFLSAFADLKQTKDTERHNRARRGMVNLRDPDMAAVLLEYGWAKWQRAATPEQMRAARELLEYSVLLDERIAEASIRMGQTFATENRKEQTFATGNRKEQLRWYERAFRIAPSDPNVLAEFLLASIRTSGNLTGIPSLRGTLLQAIERCRHWAGVGVCLPQAFYRMGFFQWLLEQGRSSSPSPDTAWSHPDVMRSLLGSLIAYSRAAELSDSEADICEERQRITALRGAVGLAIPGEEWVDRLLLLEIAAKVWAGARKCGNEARENSANAIKEGKLEETKQAVEKAKEVEQEARKMAVACLGQERSQDCPCFDGPIAVFVGGCNEAAQDMVERYRPHIETALQHFHGMVFCGGTDAGISGIVGAAKSFKTPFRKVAYVRNGPYVEKRLMEKTDDKEGYELRRLDGDGYTPLEIIQMWIDLLASGIDPSDVRVVGINGGALSAFELRLALSMGARVGVIRQSGGAAREILEDADWKDHPRLLALPDDVQTVKALVIGESSTAAIDEQTRTRIAETVHNERAALRRQKNTARSDREWPALDPFFKRSVQERINYWDHLLEPDDMRIVKVDTVPSGAEVVQQFTAKERDRMAEMEHARWNVERLSGGQKYGKEKKDEKTHPDLVPWRDLSAIERQKDVDYVDQILRVKHFGYCIVRNRTH